MNVLGRTIPCLPAIGTPLRIAIGLFSAPQPMWALSVNVMYPPLAAALMFACECPCRLRLVARADREGPPAAVPEFARHGSLAKGG